MKKDSKNDKVKYFGSSKVNLPSFVNNLTNASEVISVDGTNVIRVPFGLRSSKKKKPEKSQNIATLVLPLNSYNSPTPPPFVA